MKLMRVQAIARKEFIQIFRDPRSLGMGIAMPLVLLLLFGYALTMDVDNVPLVVWDQSRTPVSRDFTSRFAGSPYFSLRRAVSSYRELEHALDTRAALAALVIPADLAARLARGRDVQVQLIVDGSDANTATLASGYAEAIALNCSREFALHIAQRNGVPLPALPVEVRPRVWFNPDMESRNYIIPGLIAVIMMIIAALLTSLTVAREWERGTMEQLISTPVKRVELILGKLLPYFCIGMLDVLLAVVVGEFLFHVPLRGSLVLLFVISALFLVGALSLGIFISVVARGQLLASQMAMVLTFLPSFLLSGFMYAIPNMPRPIQGVTHLIPARYFVAMLKGIYLKGAGLHILAAETLLLLLFGALMFTLATVRLRKKLM